MAVSAVGVFAAYTASTAAPDRSYAVVVTDIPSGQKLTAADLDLVPLELPSEQARVSFTDLDLLVGATALAPLRNGQLVAEGSVVRPKGGDGRAQISLSVAPGNALNGQGRYLGSGELVDIIATFTESGAPQTRTVARSAVVVEVFAGAEVIGGSGSVTIVVSVPPTDLEPLAQAAAVARLSVARTTGLERPAEPPVPAGAVSLPEPEEDLGGDPPAPAPPPPPAPAPPPPVPAPAPAPPPPVPDPATAPAPAPVEPGGPAGGEAAPAEGEG
jgi:hypothetical protein